MTPLAGVRGQRREPAGRPGIRRERLLGEDVLPRRDRGAEDRRLLGHGHRDVDDGDPIVREQLAEVPVDVRHAVPGRDVPRPVQVDVGDADDLEAGHPVGDQVLAVDDAARADDGDRTLVRVGDDESAGVGDVPEEIDHHAPALAVVGSR